MKKFIYIAFALLTLSLNSCGKEEVGGTATQEMSGQWYVTWSYPDGTRAAGWDTSMTFNSSANVPNEMLVSDQNGQMLPAFWDYTVKVTCDPEAKTFASEGWVDNYSYECKCRITNGKITPNGATTPTGHPADAIEYDIEFDDDPDGTIWHVSGFRQTGFQGDFIYD